MYVCTVCIYMYACKYMLASVSICVSVVHQLFYLGIDMYYVRTHMYGYVCMYACMHVCMCVYMHVAPLYPDLNTGNKDVTLP